MPVIVCAGRIIAKPGYYCSVFNTYLYVTVSLRMRKVITRAYDIMHPIALCSIICGLTSLSEKATHLASSLLTLPRQTVN